MCAWLSVCLSACLSVSCLSVCLSVCVLCRYDCEKVVRRALSGVHSLYKNTRIQQWSTNHTELAPGSSLSYIRITPQTSEPYLNHVTVTKRRSALIHCAPFSLNVNNSELKITCENDYPYTYCIRLSDSIRLRVLVHVNSGLLFEWFWCNGKRNFAH